VISAVCVSSVACVTGGVYVTGMCVTGVYVTSDECVVCVVSVVVVGPDLHPSPLEKIEWVSDLCPIFIFPSVEGVGVGHF
jgi:hypothetical protein